MSKSYSFDKRMEDLPGEEWRDILGYEGCYQVSNMGRVKSLTRKVWNYTKPGRILSPGSKKNGYLHVALRKGDNIEKHAHVHRLVALAFIENTLHLPEVNHKNFDKTDNRVENLEWVDSASNKAHYRKSQHARLAEQKKSRKLACRALQHILDHKDDVCSLYDKGYSVKEIHDELGLGRDRISDILKIYGRL